MREQFDIYMKQCPAIAILRGITPAEVKEVCDCLFEAGVTLFEIPLNSPDAVKSVAIAAEHCAGRQMVGAGTVLTPEDVRQVHRAGGTFIVSPNTDDAVIRETKKLNMVSIPGFFTATEGFAAAKAGADYLKLFPAILGPGYIKDLKAVIKTPILAVGGVKLSNIPDFMNVCAGVGIGSALYKSGKALDAILQDTIAIVQAVKSAL